MIIWMQKHKKYLIPTIWISVIAFVGAGFVGWGAYDFNSDRTSAVAKVGNQKILIRDFQSMYGNYFEYFKSVYGDDFTKEKADELGLKQVVLDELINNALLLNYASDQGLMVLDSDVAALLARDPNFQQNGTFDKDLYYSLLKNVGISTSEYENGLKKSALLEKIGSALALPATKSEKELLGASLFLKDKISISTINILDDEIKITENETKAYWEIQKNNFLTEKLFSFESIFVPLVDKKLDETSIEAHYNETKYFYKDIDDKILDFETAKKQVELDLRFKNTENIALETYLEFKKGNASSQKNITVKESSNEFNATNFQTASTGDVLSPIKKDDGYIVLKLIEVTLPEVKTYENAKKQVTTILKDDKRISLLKERAESRLVLFSGDNVGYVSREGPQLINGMSSEQYKQLINTIFSSKAKKGYAIFGGTALLYSIDDQVLPTESEIVSSDKILKSNIEQLKNDEMKQKMINVLKTQYKIEQYIKG